MTKKLLLVVGSLLLISGTIALQGCSDSGPYGYGPGYYSSRAYYSEPGYYAGNGYVGDYQARRYWQDRDINNDARGIRQGQANIRHDNKSYGRIWRTTTTARRLMSKQKSSSVVRMYEPERQI